MATTNQHQCRPLWVSELGPVATCSAHFWQPVGPNPAPAASAPTGGTR